MKIYVASTIQPEVSFRDIYLQVAKEIAKLGHQPFNPYGSDGALLPWPNRLDALTKECQGLYLLQGWCNCVQAVTERHLCLAAGKVIFFQSAEEKRNAIDQKKLSIIERVQGAVHEATGLTLDEYRVHSRKEELFFARMIFAQHCSKEGLTPTEICTVIDRNKSMVYHYLKHYPDEFKFTPTFRNIATYVEQILG